MAILPEIPGIRATIQSFDRVLPEYIDQSDWTEAKWAHIPEHKRVSTYVECQSGAEFLIRLSIEPPFTVESESITVQASVDGRLICQATHLTNYLRSGNGYLVVDLSKVVERLSPTSVSRRSLKFSSLQKVDESDTARVQQDAKAITGVGSIVILVFRTSGAFNNRVVNNEILGTPSEIAEKALKGKAISNHVVYGNPVVQSYTSHDVYFLDGNNPIALFLFKYRSREDLQAEMIIPRPPSPLSAASSSSLPHLRLNASNLPTDRAARLAQLKREIEEIKSEEEEGKAGPSNKRHLPSSRAYKTSQGSNGKIIVDLTEDD